MFLSHKEIAELTGKQRPSAQFRELIRQGYRPDRRLDGRPVLAREAVLDRHCKHATPRVFEPDLSDIG